jgi:hypothetical protein
MMIFKVRRKKNANLKNGWARELKIETCCCLTTCSLILLACFLKASMACDCACQSIVTVTVEEIEYQNQIQWEKKINWNRAKSASTFDKAKQLKTDKKNTQNKTVNNNYSTPQFNRDKQKKINIKIKIWNQIE